MKNKIYLREVITNEKYSEREELKIFEGNIEEDKKCLKKYHNAKVRYFELKEKVESKRLKK